MTRYFLQKNLTIDLKIGVFEVQNINFEILNRVKMYIPMTIVSFSYVEMRQISCNVKLQQMWPKNI
jgi:hypothetical protein